jgi:hypothetical protein
MKSGHHKGAAFPVVVIGASAAGFVPLQTIFAALPATFSAAVLVVLHMDPGTPSRLPAILALAGPLHAAHPRDGDPLGPGRVYVAPPDQHLVVCQRTVRLTREGMVHYLRPAADVLFLSAAREFGAMAIGVVLSGNGQDGAAGLAAIRATGGVAIVQEPFEALAPSMPAHALAAANPQHRLPAAQIGPMLDKLVRTHSELTAGFPAHLLRGAAAQRRAAPRRSLRSLPVLIAEDRYLVATEIARMLREMGCEPVGPAPDLAAAFRLLEREGERVGAAVLDVDLRGESVFPLAAVLCHLGIPIVFATGYDQGTLPYAWFTYPRVEKPFTPPGLESALRVALRTQPRRSEEAAQVHGQPVDRIAELLKESRNLLMASGAIIRRDK